MAGRAPLFDPSGGWVVKDPPGKGKGNWAGAPSSFYDEEEGRFFLPYRLRKPLTEGRGYLTCVAESKDAREFNETWTGKAAEFDSPSIERSALIKAPEGGHRSQPRSFMFLPTPSRTPPQSLVLHRYTRTPLHTFHSAFGVPGSKSM